LKAWKDRAVDLLLEVVENFCAVDSRRLNT
jgi:hypothetical protein